MKTKILLYMLSMTFLVFLAPGVSNAESTIKPNGNIAFIIDGILPTETSSLESQNLRIEPYDTYINVVEKFDSDETNDIKDRQKIFQMKHVARFMKDKLNFNALYVIWPEEIKTTSDESSFIENKTLDMDTVKNAFFQIQENATKFSNIFVFINSHYNAETESFCLAEKRDSSPTSAHDVNSALPDSCHDNMSIKRDLFVELIRSLKSENNNKHVLVFIDSCNAGDIFSGIKEFRNINYIISSIDSDSQISNSAVGYLIEDNTSNNGCFLKRTDFFCDEKYSQDCRKDNNCMKSFARCYPIPPFYCNFMRNTIDVLKEDEDKLYIPLLFRYFNERFLSFTHESETASGKYVPLSYPVLTHMENSETPMIVNISGGE